MSNISCPPVYLAADAFDQHLAEQDRLIKITTSSMMVFLSIPTMLVNLLIVWTIYKNKTLHTPSYILICSLALTDFGAALVSIPINAYWKLIELTDNNSMDICGTFSIGFTMAFTFFSASELTVTALSVDRYLAIRWSSRYRARVTNSRVVKTLLFIWCIAILWGVTSVMVTSKVLHGTVVFVGIVTFGAIFLCCGLSLKSLYTLESKTDARVTPLKNEQRNGQSEQRQCRRKDGHVKLKMNIPFFKGNVTDNLNLNGNGKTNAAVPISRTIQHSLNAEYEDADPSHKVVSTHKTHDSDIELKPRIRRVHSTPTLSNNNPFQESNHTHNHLASSIATDSEFKNVNHSERQNGEAVEFERAPKHVFSSQSESTKLPKFKVVKYKYTMVTLLWIVVLLILCYAPYFLLSIAIVVIGMTNEIIVAWSVTITCICINSFLNPLIYFWRFRKLKNACLKTLKGCRQTSTEQ